MIVKRIQPKELPTECVFRLNYLYHADLGKFVAITNRTDEVLYINQTVSQKDIEGFLEVIKFPDYAVAQPETKTGEFLEYVYNEYGSCTYLALMDAHSWNMKRIEERKTKEAAKAVLPVIEKEVNSQMPIAEFNERLIYEIQLAGNNLGRKTPKNIIGYGNVYSFYFGYLMGAGMLKEVMPPVLDLAV